LSASAELTMAAKASAGETRRPGEQRKSRWELVSGGFFGARTPWWNERQVHSSGINPYP
jgi:hypothetical protein